jgi:transposase-like protein
MTTRDIRAHLREMYDVKVPADLISRVTDAAAALDAFTAALQQRCPAIVRLWRAHWAEFTPFLAFPPEVRNVIYRRTRESMNPRLRKVTRNRASPLRAGRPQSPLPRGPQPGEFRGRNVGIRSSWCHHQRLMVLR